MCFRARDLQHRACLSGCLPACHWRCSFLLFLFAPYLFLDDLLDLLYVMKKWVFFSNYPLWTWFASGPAVRCTLSPVFLLFPSFCPGAENNCGDLFVRFYSRLNIEILNILRAYSSFLGFIFTSRFDLKISPAGWRYIRWRAIRSGCCS